VRGRSRAKQRSLVIVLTQGRPYLGHILAPCDGCTMVSTSDESPRTSFALARAAVKARIARLDILWQL
jgi:hypothetical protein